MGNNGGEGTPEQGVGDGVDAQGSTPVQAAPARQIVVERQGQGAWAIWDSLTQAWEEGGKEQEAIRTARERAQGAGTLCELVVVGQGRKVKYRRTYNGKAKRAGGSGRKTKAYPTARPPLPGEETPAGYDAGAMTTGGQINVPDPVPALRAPQDAAIDDTHSPEAIPLSPGVPAVVPRSRFVLLLTVGDAVVAIAPEHVAAIEQGRGVDEGRTFVHLVGGEHFSVRGDVVSLVQLLEVMR
jgi:hypothetical protein